LNTMRGRVDFEHAKITLGGITQYVGDIRNSRRLMFIACGTSYHSAHATRALVEELTLLPVEVEIASDFLDRAPAISRADTCVFISQSGETADTLKALEYCKQRNALCVGIVNAVGTAIPRQTHCGIYLNCGPEIGVASTKAYTSQIIAITLMALKLGDDKSHTEERRRAVIKGLQKLPELVNKVLSMEPHIKDIAAQIKDSRSLLLMGRGYQFATCLEAALKIKELTYMHAEGINSGELKHGTLALIDETMPIVFVATKDRFYDRVKSGFEQVTARKGKPVMLCSDGDESIPSSLSKIRLPVTEDCLQVLLNIVPMQLLAYHIAVQKGLNVDQPRNLAKSVTVQ